jgi:hypothetical protein
MSFAHNLVNVYKPATTIRKILILVIFIEYLRHFAIMMVSVGVFGIIYESEIIKLICKVSLSIIFLVYRLFNHFIGPMRFTDHNSSINSLDLN